MQAAGTALERLWCSCRFEPELKQGGSWRESFPSSKKVSKTSALQADLTMKPNKMHLANKASTLEIAEASTAKACTRHTRAAPVVSILTAKHPHHEHCLESLQPKP